MRRWDGEVAFSMTSTLLPPTRRPQHDDPNTTTTKMSGDGVHCSQRVGSKDQGAGTHGDKSGGGAHMPWSPPASSSRLVVAVVNIK